MHSPLTPSNETACAEVISDAAAHGTPLAIVGGGTRPGLGGTARGTRLSTTGLTGITLYEPAEMIISAMAGTPLAEIETTLAKQGQMLPFEPMDHRRLLGTNGTPTIGAVAAGNISGPRRLIVGAARDHLIGIRMINGLGEIIKSGGRVMKNVTGLDLVKLNAGALGTLGVLTEVTFKVLPRPETTLTLRAHDLAHGEAIAAMCEALATPFEVSAAAYIEADAETRSQTILRLEGFAESGTYRADRLRSHLAEYGKFEIVSSDDQSSIWADIRDAQRFAAPQFEAVMRVHVAASKAPAIVAAAIDIGAKVMIDWGGALLWLGVDDSRRAQEVIAKAAELGGYPFVVRSSDGTLMPHQPANPAVAALGQRVKKAFDPKGIFNPGLYSGHI